MTETTMKTGYQTRSDVLFLIVSFLVFCPKAGSEDFLFFCRIPLEVDALVAEAWDGRLLFTSFLNGSSMMLDEVLDEGIDKIFRLTGGFGWPGFLDGEALLDVVASSKASASRGSESSRVRIRPVSSAWIETTCPPVPARDGN